MPAGVAVLQSPSLAGSHHTPVSKGDRLVDAADFTTKVLAVIKEMDGVASASEIEGACAIGVELETGEEFFLDVTPA
jgi:hypothetical protein